MPRLHSELATCHAIMLHAVHFAAIFPGLHSRISPKHRCSSFGGVSREPSRLLLEASAMGTHALAAVRARAAVDHQQRWKHPTISSAMSRDDNRKMSSVPKFPSTRFICFVRSVHNHVPRYEVFGSSCLWHNIGRQRWAAVDYNG